MQFVPEFVVYINNAQRAPTATYKAINQEKVYLSKSESYLDRGRWNERKIEEVCPLIMEWKAEVLWGSKYVFYLYSNSCSMILHQIKEVMFPHLKQMSFCGNSIESVEAFNRVHLPLLVYLWMGTYTNIQTKTTSAALLISKKGTGQT